MKRLKVLVYGITHEHSFGKLETLRRMPEVFEIVGVVDDRATATVPNYTNHPVDPDGFRILTAEEALSVGDLDVVVIETEQNFSIYQNSTYKTTFPLSNMGFNSSAIGEWHKFRIDLRTDGYVTITDLEDNTKTFTNVNAFTGTANRVGFLTNNTTTELRVRNVKVYPV